MTADLVFLVESTSTAAPSSSSSASRPVGDWDECNDCDGGGDDSCYGKVVHGAWSMGHGGQLYPIMVVSTKRKVECDKQK